jgi:hypothetical protein
MELPLPSPLLPPPDMERIQDERMCDLGILQKKQVLNERVQSMLRTKAACLVAEAQLASDVYRQESAKVRPLSGATRLLFFLVVANCHCARSPSLPSSLPQHSNAANIAVATLEFELSKSRVDMHRWRQRTALLKVKLSAAEEDLESHRRMGALLHRQMELEAASRQEVGAQAELLRGRLLDMQAAMEAAAQRAAAVRDELAESNAALEESRAAAEQMRRSLELDGDHARVELAAAQARAAGAEQAAAAGKERAALAEQTLCHREALATERAQLQADVQGFSKDLAKMALETGSAANTQLQQAVAEAQGALFAERGVRAEADARAAAAEARAAAAEARAAALEREVARLERQVDAKGRRVGSLEDALRQREAAATPARQVTRALDAVGVLVSQLDGTPGTEEPVPAAAPLLGGAAKPKARGGRKAKDAAPAALSDDEDRDPDFGPPEAAKHKQRSAGRADPAAAKPARRQPRAGGDGPPAAAELPELAAVEQDNEQEEDVAPKAQRGGPKRKQPAAEPAAAADPPGTAAGKRAKRDKGGAASVLRAGLEAAWGDEENAPASGDKPPSKMDQRPLQALNPGVVAAAASHAARPLLPLKPAVTKSVLAPLAGGPQPGKRRLLGVSTANFGAVADALPAAQLFGQNFKVPKLHGAK